MSSAILSAPALESALHCRHCGDPCGASPLRLKGEVFCCAGCATVFDLLASHDLTAFYTCDVSPGRSQKAAGRRRDDRFAALDDPIVTARLTRAIGDRTRATLPIPDLHCASCLWLLEQLWRFDAGILRSEANLLDRTVTIDFAPGRTTLRRAAELLARLGYEPVISGESRSGHTPVGRRRLYLRLGVAGFAFGNVMLFSIPQYVNGGPLEPGFQRLFDTLNLVFSLPVLCYSAGEFFRPAWQAVRGRTITLDVPIALGLIVLFGRSLFEIVTGTGEGFLDSFTGLVFFLLIGRLFQRKAFEGIDFDRTMRSFLPLSVVTERAGVSALTPFEQVATGDTIVVRPSEIVPADSALLDDRGSIDYAFVTGEQAPVSAVRGEIVRAGGRVLERTLRLTVARPVSQSQLARLWSDPVFGSAKRHWLDVVLASFGWWFTVSALACAAAGAWYWWPDAGRAATVATAVLIIACPCAFTLAAPMALGTAMGALGRAGVYLKRPAVALDLSRISLVVFDKTGTLTCATPDADAAAPTMAPEQWVLVRHLAAQSVHPVSRAIAGRLQTSLSVTGVEEIAGAGLTGNVAGRRVALGSASFVRRITGRELPDESAVAWAAVDDGPPQPIQLAARDRAELRRAIAALGEGYETWLLSGDDDREAVRWRSVFGNRLRFRQTPEGKLSAVRSWQRSGERVLMAGDGLNDAGALAAADVGLAVSDDTACLVPACDALIRGDRLARLPQVLAYARRARRVIVLCFAVSIAYNALGLALALTAQLTPLATAILMPVSSLTIVGLATGLMRRGAREVLA